METRKLIEQKYRRRSLLRMYVEEKSEIPLVLNSGSSNLGGGKAEGRARYPQAFTIDGQE